MKTGISEQAFQKSAAKIGCDTKAIKAVDNVESKGSGFLPSGEVKILFEPHIFWKEIKKRGIKPIVSDICYPTWGTKPYGKMSEQHARLQKAVIIHREAALMSCSWGRFQIMGFNFSMCGCTTFQEFINRMNQSEESQLELFTNYIISTQLDDELIEKDWSGFARGYNGPLYVKNNYHGKLNTAYNLMK